MGSTLASWALKALFLIVFNSIYFVVFDENNPADAAATISYVFIQISYIIMLIVISCTKSRRNLAVLSFSLYSIAAAYFAVTLLAGCIFMALNHYAASAFIVQAVISAVFAALLLASYLANLHTAGSIEKQRQDGEFLQQFSAQLQVCLDLVRRSGNAQAADALNELITRASSSPLVSSPQAGAVEQQLMAALAELKEACVHGQYAQVSATAQSMIFDLSHRNTLLKQQGV